MNFALHVITYHYVRDPDNSSFPRIKGILPERFRAQLVTLQARYEMATIESALDFLAGRYQPSRDLCLLTFDDGLKDHYVVVAPLLIEMGLQGLFFVITACLEENSIVAVHMNHLLMGGLDFETYEQFFLCKLADLLPTREVFQNVVDPSQAKRAYPWDEPRVASFKYLVNFVLEPAIRDEVIRAIFEAHVGHEESMARTLYLSWEEGRQMQASGMILGGHSHRHRPLAKLRSGELDEDLRTCKRLLGSNLRPQWVWPFCYPYGSPGSFNEKTREELNRLGFACSFTTQPGTNTAGTDLYALCRTDCNDV
jgi:peptidoglycan/xylan/chitin deacetylase (PgdA/CDA1 family)